VAEIISIAGELTLLFTVSTTIKGIVSKLTIKFWMCQKCGRMKDYNNKKLLQVL
jgi:hypothetical protein